MLESYKWMGWDWDWDWDWKSLQALILRAPLCSANKQMRFRCNACAMKSPLDQTGGKGRAAASEEYRIANMRPSTSNAQY